MAYGGSTNTNILSDETFDILCRICKREGKNCEAEKYCLECQDYYCLKCVKVHQHVPALTGHKILDKSQFPSGSIKKQLSVKPGSKKQQPMAPTERCDRHTHHCIDMYCQNHDNIGCGTCMGVDHRLCQDIFYIPDFLQNNASPSAPTDIKQNLESVYKTLKNYHENLQCEKQQLLKRKAESVENIRKFRKEINDRLDELEKNTVADIEDKYKILINKIEEGMKLLDTNKAKVTSARDKLASADNNVSQDFVNTKKGKYIARSAVKYLEDNKSLIYTNDSDFIPDQRILTLLEEIHTLGKTLQRSTMSTNVTGKSQQTAEKEQKYSASGNVQQQTETLLQVKGSKKYSVRIKSDKSCCDIVSACTLEDGTIILSDRFNKKLKRIDSSMFTVTDYCDLPEQPYQVCAINKHQVAVSLFMKQEINFIEVKNRMTITNKIKTDFACFGLAYAGGNLYISGYGTSVYIYSMSGRKMKLLCKNQEGQAMFSNIRSLAVTVDGSRIYVTDYQKGLIVLDSNGRVVGKFNGSQLQYAHGSDLTARGSLLVCGYGSNNLLQFGRNGELIGEVVKSTGNIWAICCNQQMSKMIIGMTDNDEIEVYDLE